VLQPYSIDQQHPRGKKEKDWGGGEIDEFKGTKQVHISTGKNDFQQEKFTSRLRRLQMVYAYFVT
jgi:hypothetical protein